MRYGTHGNVRDDRRPVARRDRDCERVRPGERLAAIRMRQATRRRCGENADETTLGESPHPVAEHPCRKASSSDDHASAFRWVGDGRAHDLLEHEVAERTVPVPALEALLRFEQERTSCRIEVERLEPVDPRETVPDLPAPFRVLEMCDECVDRRQLQPKRRQAGPRLAKRHRPGNAIVLKRSVGQPRVLATRRSSRSALTAIG